MVGLEEASAPSLHPLPPQVQKLLASAVAEPGTKKPWGVQGGEGGGDYIMLHSITQNALLPLWGLTAVSLKGLRCSSQGRWPVKLASIYI